MNWLEQIEPYTNEMLEKLGRLVAYNSVQGEAKEGMPFGQIPADCLNEALKMTSEMGFHSVNMENYCGYAEMGQGEDIIGIVGHLDIVPAGEGWSSDPFILTQKDGKVYGRGVSDDKGAAIAALYAMKLVQDSGIPLNKRVRLLLGCNEETGSACMRYYNAHGEKITTGFTPDGNFPGIHGEKGAMQMTFSSKNTQIIEMNGGFVSNAVCNSCVTKIPANSINVSSLEKALKNTALPSFHITSDDDIITIFATGVSAHASTPLLGVNAAGCTMAALEEAGMTDDFVTFYNQHIGTSCDGSGIGCKISDAYGPLTLNNGIIQTQNGVISGTIDIRYPVTYTPEQLRSMAEPYLEDQNGKFEIIKISQPLFYPENSPLVENLLDAYITITGDTQTKPMVIGGGTYAKSIPGIIAFGCEFPGIDNHIHDANECLSIDEFKLQVAIYAQAIINLLNS